MTEERVGVIPSEAEESRGNGMLMFCEASARCKGKLNMTENFAFAAVSMLKLQ